MIAKKMEKALNEQIREELASAYLYLAMAAYFAHDGWDGMAGWMRIQAREEQEHAMRLFDHIVERGGQVKLPALAEPQATWASPLAAFQAAYKHEQHITGCIHGLVELAQEEKDYAAEVMLQWFVAEQVEEEDHTMKAVQLLERMGSEGRGLVMADRELGRRTAEKD
ncbi:MAG: Ferritin-like protein 2 [Candidatus Bipolaricaulis sibiricus]|uniref:Ferritin n=1 Tax=Bipolaricaulis sibiricus TaxID=2501609 RepID=A0A410FVU9_BIPS1|nr:MAG: Ferritin-like protein 2 [Candidatus Bipolaricaulis sibiricus]